MFIRDKKNRRGRWWCPQSWNSVSHRLNSLLLRKFITTHELEENVAGSLVVCAVSSEPVSHPFSLFNRELTGKTFIFGFKTSFLPMQPLENVEFYINFPKKLTGKFISRAGK